MVSHQIYVALFVAVDLCDVVFRNSFVNMHLCIVLPLCKPVCELSQWALGTKHQADVQMDGQARKNRTARFSAVLGTPLEQLTKPTNREEIQYTRVRPKQ